MASVPARTVGFETVRDQVKYSNTSPEEITNLVAYVSSALASATNGAAIRADGGVVPTIA
jgi:enoyl-[acyl-carrier-protein] reductase (NADH)